MNRGTTSFYRRLTTASLAGHSIHRGTTCSIKENRNAVNRIRCPCPVTGTPRRSLLKNLRMIKRDEPIGKNSFGALLTECIPRFPSPAFTNRRLSVQVRKLRYFFLVFAFMCSIAHFFSFVKGFSGKFRSIACFRAILPL